ncbi:MAG: TrmH family RNA methyltransferase [Clostridia bacterium]|jgi:tRNA G18 (ribose-2'-O)-methylase SpoU
MDHESLSLFNKLRDRDYAREGLLVCEGRLVLEKAMAAGLRIRSILCVPSDEETWQARAPAGTTVLSLSRPQMEAHVGFAFHRGVLALAERPDQLTTQSEAGGLTADSLESRQAPADPGGSALVLWNVTDPDNLGALVRSAAALGARSVWLGPGCADPYGRKALRTSMGCVLSLPLLTLSDAAGLAALRDRRYVAAAALVHGANLPGAVPSERPVALVMGNEGWGLPPEVLAACDGAVMLPMDAGVDSLNVGAAGAILMWELFRR